MFETAEQGRPVLGVCFGHQLLAWRAGARVVKNPKGRELGTVFVELTERGRSSPLFAGFPERFDVQATHEDMVEGGALEVLASNAAGGMQAFSLGPRTFGVQFHPEMDATSIQFCIDAARDQSGGMRGGDALEATQSGRVRPAAVARETPWGERLMRRFIEQC